MNRLVSIACILLLSFQNISKAQPYFDLVNLHGQWSNPFSYSSSDSTTINTRFLAADLSIPFKVKKHVIAISLSLSDFSIASDYFTTIQLNSLLVSTAYVRQWKNEKIKTSFVLIGRTNNDPDLKIGSNTIQLGGVLLHNIKKSEHLKFKFGMYYNSEFFGPFILPLAGIDWNINERMNLFGVLPGSMNLEYLLTSRIHVGLAFRSMTNSYRQANNTFLRIYDNHLKAVCDFYIAKKHVISFEAGHSILRKYRPGFRKSGETTYAELDVADGYLLKLAYAFRFRIDEK